MDTFGETATTTTTTTHPFAACCCINWNLLTQERRMPKTPNSAKTSSSNEKCSDADAAMTQFSS
jgi:hypothetical protein